MAPKHQPSIAIIGGGVSGITIAIDLRKKLGLESFTIYERDARTIGGTWRDNVYPGYSLSTELNPDWTSVYSGREEIQRYWEAVHRKHQLESHTRYDSNFVSATWQNDTQTYRIQFKHTDGTFFEVEADILISCIGGFSVPLFSPPDLVGLKNYKGQTFHSARWRYDIPLEGKRVGVIGNGSSATQFIPVISKDSTTEIINFVRTPSWCTPRPQADYSAVTKSMFAYVPGLMRSYRSWLAVTLDVQAIAWQTRFSGVRKRQEEALTKFTKATAPAEYHDFLVPKYPLGCKRIIYDPGYLQCLNQPNVSLVTSPITTITSTGILTSDGIEHELDVLILGTGYDVSGGIALNVTGENGKTLVEQWEEAGGPQAYLGTTLPNFPNFFTIAGPNTFTGHASVIYATESQSAYITRLIRPLLSPSSPSSKPTITVTAEADARYNAHLQKRISATVFQSCSSWYRVPKTGKVVGVYREFDRVVVEDFGCEMAGLSVERS